MWGKVGVLLLCCGVVLGRFAGQVAECLDEDASCQPDDGPSCCNGYCYKEPKWDDGNCIKVSTDRNLKYTMDNEQDYTEGPVAGETTEATNDDGGTYEEATQTLFGEVAMGVKDAVKNTVQAKIQDILGEKIENLRRRIRQKNLMEDCLPEKEEEAAEENVENKE